MLLLSLIRLLCSHERCLGIPDQILHVKTCLSVNLARICPYKYLKTVQSSILKEILKLKVTCVVGMRLDGNRHPSVVPLLCVGAPCCCV